MSKVTYTDIAKTPITVIHKGTWYALGNGGKGIKRKARPPQIGRLCPPATQEVLAYLYAQGKKNIVDVKPAVSVSKKPRKSVSDAVAGGKRATGNSAGLKGVTAGSDAVQPDTVLRTE